MLIAICRLMGLTLGPQSPPLDGKSEIIIRLGEGTRGQTGEGAHLLGGPTMTASICCRSRVLGLRSRSSTPRAMLRASLAAFSSEGFSRPTCTHEPQKLRYMQTC